MQQRRRRSIATLALALLATSVWVSIPGSHVQAATIYYNGAGSAPRISVIGDSTIAALRWTNQFGPLQVFNFTYDAESCRRTVLPSCRGREGYTPDNTLSAMRRLSGQLGSVLVIMGGYDDPSFGFGSAVDAVMGEAIRQGIPNVMWLTLRHNVSYVGPGGISYSGTFRSINATLMQKSRQYGPRLQIADWATYSANHSEWFYADGIHFRPAGATAVASYIANQAGRVINGQIITPAAGLSKPSQPRSLAAAVGYGVGSGRVRLTWQAPLLPGGYPITDYVIQRSSNGGSTWVSLSDGVSTGRSYVASGLTNGQSYRFRVAARNALGWGTVSAVTAIPRATIPSASRSLTALPGSRQVVLSWNLPSSNGGLRITDYVVQRSWNGGQTWVSLSDGVSTNRSYTATGLTNGATYHFRVAARNAVGWGPVSNVAAATPRALVPAAPRSLTATPGSRQVRLRWLAPSPNGGPPVTDYVIQRSWNGGQTWVSLPDGVSTNTAYTATGLTNGATYQFRVVARNSAGAGRVSNVVTATPRLAFATQQATVSTVAPTTTTSTTSTTTTTTTTTTPSTTSTTSTPDTSTTTPVVPPPVDTGEVEPTTTLPTASWIGDLVWLDANDNGLQDVDEPGVEGVEIALLDAAGVELARTVTDRHGEYEFTELGEGSYLVEIALPEGYRIALPDQLLDDEVDSDLITVDEVRRTARSDVLAIPAEHPDGVDVGLVPDVDEPDTTTTEPPEDTTTTTPETSSSQIATTTAAPEPTTTQPASPTTEATTTTESTSTTAAPTTAAPTTLAAIEPTTTAAAG
jgi:SdrD B-like protein/fibronectin type III domain protein